MPKKRRAVFINASSAAGQPLRAHPGLVHVNAIGDLFRRQLFFSFLFGLVLVDGSLTFHTLLRNDLVM